MHQHAPFHYAFKVTDLEKTRLFYTELLPGKEGRSTDSWVDFDLFGNQLSAHLSTSIPPLDYCGKVDGISVPIPHFGCIISVASFAAIRAKLEGAGIDFIVKPTVRYAGQKGEQHTLFFLDPSGNPIEFKAFTHPEEVFTAE